VAGLLPAGLWGEAARVPPDTSESEPVS